MRRVFRVGVGPRRLGRELDDEIAFHLETKVQQLVASGLSADDARAKALAEFGDADAVRNDCLIEDQQRERSMRRMNFIDELRQDVAYATRTLRRNPLFASIIVLTLGLGIAANTSIFTLVNAVLLRPLPVDSPQDLVAIGDPRRTNSFSDGSARNDLISYPLYRDIRDRNGVMPDILASGRSPSFLVRASSTETGAGARARFVSGNYFRVLRVPALIGRTFDGSEDDNVGASPVVVISYSYWKSRFGTSNDVVGKTIYLSAAAVPMTIIGVTPPWFTGEIVGQSRDMWIPISMQEVLQPHEKVLSDRSASWLLLMGRRPPGVSLEQAKAAITPVLRRSIIDHPIPGQPYDSTDKVFIESGARGFSSVRANYATPLKTLMAGVALLLLIICANVANLLLARALARSKEMGVRMAIGAGRTRLVRQLLTESVLLGGLGAVVGLAAAVWGSRLLLKLVASGGSVIPLDLSIDLPVLGFTAGLAMLAVLLSGFVPALRTSQVDLASTMRANAGSITRGGMSLRGQRVPVGRMVIGAQVALSMVLLVGASLLVRSLRGIEKADSGMDREHLLNVDVNAVPNGYTQERLLQLELNLADRIKAIPGVSAVTFSENGIFAGTESMNTMTIPGFVGKSQDDSAAFSDNVGPDYARSIGSRVLRGRDISPQDMSGGAPIVTINEAMAKHFFGSGNPVGRIVRFDDTTSATIVGVMGDVKDHSLTEEVAPRIYLAQGQHLLGWAGALRLLVRTSGDPVTVVPQIRAVITSVDSRLKNASIEPVTVLMRDSISQERLLARLATGFGLMALLLAAIGLYGVMTYAVTRRTAEIGLRVALGAQRGDVIGMVLRDAMGVVVAGVIVGVPASLFAARLLQSQLHGVGTTDPVSLSVALSVMVVSAAAAAFAPALRASRVPPLLSLRQE
jgi:predicted permease